MYSSCCLISVYAHHYIYLTNKMHKTPTTTPKVIGWTKQPWNWWFMFYIQFYTLPKCDYILHIWGFGLYQNSKKLRSLRQKSSSLGKVSKCLIWEVKILANVLITSSFGYEDTLYMRRSHILCKLNIIITLDKSFYASVIIRIHYSL